MMRTWKQRTLALMISVTMLCGCIVSVSAAKEAEYYNRISAASLDIKEGFSVQLFDSAGIEVEKTTEPVNAVEAEVYKNVVKLKLTMSQPVAGQQYVVMLLSGGEEIPTNSNIRYIDQDTAENGFIIYPDQISEVGKYNVVVSSADGKVTAASFEVLDPPYKLGDVDEDKAITASDAAKILRMVVGSEQNVTKMQELAANVDGDTAVTASDAAKVLRVVVGSDTLE